MKFVKLNAVRQEDGKDVFYPIYVNLDRVTTIERGTDDDKSTCIEFESGEHYTWVKETPEEILLDAGISF